MHQLQWELLQLLPVRFELSGNPPSGILQLQFRLWRVVLQRQSQLLQTQLRQQLLRLRARVPGRLSCRVLQLQFQLPGVVLKRQPQQ